MDFRLTKIYEALLSGNMDYNSPHESLSQVYEASRVKSSNKPAPSTVKPSVVAAASDYDKLIKVTIGKSNFYPKQKYKIGKSIIISDRSDQQNFRKLFSLKPPTQKGDPNTGGSGKGEIALYWLFHQNYKIVDNRDSDKADLLVSASPEKDIGIEVKSLPGNSLKLGKFKNQTENRTILSLALGIFALFKSLPGKTRPISVDVFNGSEIQSAFEVVWELDKLLAAFVKNHPKVVSTLPPVQTLLTQIQTIKNALGQPTTAEEAAGRMLKLLLKTKLERKPGWNGYYYNVFSSGQITCYKVDETVIDGLTDQQFITGVSATSGELQVNNPSIFYVKS